MDINELFASAVNKETSPMQWIEDVSGPACIAFLRASDNRDFGFVLTLNEAEKLEVAGVDLEDEYITLSDEQLAQAAQVIQRMYDDSLPSEAVETDHGMSNYDFI